METETSSGRVDFYRKQAALAEEKWALAFTDANKYERLYQQTRAELKSAQRMFERACDDEAKLIMHIIELHRKFADELQECEHCDGEGAIPEMMTCDYSSSSDSFQPAEEPGEIECDRCHGTGREWPS